MGRYYSFNPDVIGDLSTYQFQSYLDNVALLETKFQGEEPEKDNDNESLVKRAKSLGLKVPKKY